MVFDQVRLVSRANSKCAAAGHGKKVQRPEATPLKFFWPVYSAAASLSIRILIVILDSSAKDLRASRSISHGRETQSLNSYLFAILYNQSLFENGHLSTIAQNIFWSGLGTLESNICFSLENIGVSTTAFKFYSLFHWLCLIELHWKIMFAKA